MLLDSKAAAADVAPAGTVACAEPSPTAPLAESVHSLTLPAADSHDSDEGAEYLGELGLAWDECVSAVAAVHTIDVPVPCWKPYQCLTTGRTW